MLNKLKKLFGGQPSVDFAALITEGAQIIDVRSAEEYRTGHVNGSVNVPLPTLQTQLNKIQRHRPVIVCCASGVRSSSAKALLQAKGYTVYDGGGWTSLARKIQDKG